MNEDQPSDDASAEIEQSQGELESSASGYVITLVPGTWNSRGSWGQPGAFFPSYLAASIQKYRHASPPDVQVSVFPWSAWNRFGSRASAASALAEHLFAQSRKYPKYRRFVVGHSHGGAVALAALADPRFLGDVDGVACLSTPFIVLERDMAFPPLRFRLIGAGILMLLALAMLVNLATSWISPWVGAGLGAMAFSILLLTMDEDLSELRKKALSWVGRRARRLQAWTQPVCIDQRRLLIVRSSADEATSVLAATFLLARGLRLAYATLLAVGSLPGAIVQLALLGIASLSIVAFAVLCSFLAGFVLLGSTLGGDLAWWALGVAAAAVSPFLATVALLPIAALRALALLPYGWELAATSSMLSGSVADAPPGRWTVYQLMKSPRALLSHSGLYRSKAAVELLASWMVTGEWPEVHPGLRNATAEEDLFGVLPD